MNRAVLALLRSPLGRVIGRRICGLRLRGRVSGRIVELPVEYVRADRRLVVLAGHGAAKRWWRNFRTPRRVDVLIDGRWHAATGTAVLPGGAGRAAVLARYRSAHPRVPAGTTDPLVVIDLEQVLPVPEMSLWTRWFANVTVGECAGFAVPATVGALTVHAPAAAVAPLLVVAGAVEGAVLGGFQARVLRQVLPGLPIVRWTAMTAAAAALAWLVGLVPTVAGDWLSGLPPAVLVPAVAIAATVLLGSIGTAQWTVLRDHATGAGRWIWGTAVAWLAALGVFFAVTMPLWHPDQGVVTVVLIGVLGGLLMAATVAALTGLLLVRIVEVGPHDNPSRDTAAVFG
ncbi:MAG TPA: nitroreductase/quinone reductase family protein [Actinophytocola sp.]|uniref:nitroreductase/quinone reductase family protein n=1 Tax=Actinophytocola sp. TaxID=1872138 RepID=UPI002F952F25